MVSVPREERLADASETEERPVGVDLGEPVSSIGIGRTVTMRLVRIRGQVVVEARPLGLLVPCLDVPMGALALLRLAVYELAVLGAARVLDEEHVSTARALQKQRKKSEQRKSAPHYGKSGDVAARRGHRQHRV